MTADMANVIIMSDKYSKPIQYDAKEKWFGTEYKRTGVYYIFNLSTTVIDSIPTGRTIHTHSAKCQTPSPKEKV